MIMCSYHIYLIRRTQSLNPIELACPITLDIAGLDRIREHFQCYAGIMPHIEMRHIETEVLMEDPQAIPDVCLICPS